MLRVNLSILESSRAVPLGKTVTLQAIIKSNPAPSSITWKITTNEKFEEIFGCSRKYLVDNTNSPKLTIRNFEFCDSGCYSITVSNSVQTVCDYIELKVEGK